MPGIGPRVLDGTVGPGRLLAQLLADEHQIVATIVCGDDYAASNTRVDSSKMRAKVWSLTHLPMRA